ncbi:MAG: helix-turn-helix domain-containing protein [Rhizomicrobium sp.]
MIVDSVPCGILGAFKAETAPVHKQVWLVQATVAHITGVALGDLCAPTRRTPRAALSRQMAMYLCHVVFSIGVSNVARAFGRDPSTVVHALRRVEELRDAPEFDRELAGIEGLLLDSWGQL